VYRIREWRLGRAGFLFLLSVPLVAPVRAVQAQPAPPAAQGAEAPARISLTLRDTPLRSALQLLFQQTGLQHAVESAVPNAPVTLNLRDATFATALRVVTRLAGVTYRKDGDVYVIGVRQPPVEPTVREVEPPAEPSGPAPQSWEKIPIQFGHVNVYGHGLGIPMLPSELDVQGGGLGGLGGGLGGYGGLGSGWGGLGGPGSGLGGLGGLNRGWGGQNSGLGGLNSGLGGLNGTGTSYSVPRIRTGGRF